MNDLIPNITQETLIKSNELPIDLFNKYISWLDRGELTTRSYIINLRQFAAWMLYAGVKSPQRTDIVAYREWLMIEHDAIKLDSNSPNGWKYRTDKKGNIKRVKCKPGTVNQYLRSIKQFFAWTSSEGYYPNIFEHINLPKDIHEGHKKDALTITEMSVIENDIISSAEQKIEATINTENVKDGKGKVQRYDEQGKRLLAMYLLATQNGLRTIELHRANVKDFEIKGDQAWLRIWGKGRTEASQKLPLAKEVAYALEDYLESRSDPYTNDSPLFVSTGNRSKGKRIATTTISTMLKKAMVDAGYKSERLTAHSLRHTAGTTALDVTDDNIYKVQHYMRHKNPQTTEVYLHKNHDENNIEIAQMIYDRTH